MKKIFNRRAVGGKSPVYEAADSQKAARPDSPFLINGLKNKKLLPVMSTVLAVAVTAVALFVTFAADEDAIRLEQPNDYSVITKDEAAELRIIGSTSWSSGDTRLATVPSGKIGDTVTITGVDAGTVGIGSGNLAGGNVVKTFQVVDPSKITGYNIPKDGTIEMKSTGTIPLGVTYYNSPAPAPGTKDEQIKPETAQTLTYEKNDSLAGQVSWASTNESVAKVANGQLVCGSLGIAVLNGTFTDRWGLERVITLIVNVGTEARVIAVENADGTTTYWIPGDAVNSYIETDENGKVIIPPHFIYNSSGPGSEDGENLDIHLGDDGLYYVNIEGYSNIWQEFDADSGILTDHGNIIWGGADSAPGGGDDIEVIFSEYDNFYYIDWGQNVFQKVNISGSSAGAAYTVQGNDSYVGGGEDRMPGSYTKELTPIVLASDGRFYAGPFTADGFTYFIGDRPDNEGGTGELMTSGNGPGAHAAIDTTDCKYYLNYVGDMTTSQPTANPTVSGVEVTPGSASLYHGYTFQFSAEVGGSNNPPPNVIWEVYGSSNPETVITGDGMLTIAASETVNSITVRATSVFDKSKHGTAEVSVTASPPQLTNSNEKTVSMGRTSYIIKDGGSLWGVGSNNRGQLGQGDTRDRYAYTLILGGEGHTFTMVSEYGNNDQNHVIALTEEGRVFIWGYNNRGQLGDGTTTNKTTPIELKISGVAGFKYVAAGSAFSAAISDEGVLYTWGYNNYGQLGQGDTTTRNTPQAVRSGELYFKSVSAGESNMYAITESNELYAWGRNSWGQLGDGTTVQKNYPVKVNVGDNKKIIAVSGKSVGHVLAITEDYHLYAWGLNSYGRVGDGTTDNKLDPVRIMSDSTVRFSQVATGNDYSMALSTDGRLYTWGRNNEGQLGNSTKTNRSLPAAVTNPSLTYRAIAAGENSSMAVSMDGRLYIWGRNAYGQYGKGLTGNESLVPQLISIS